MTYTYIRLDVKTTDADHFWSISFFKYILAFFSSSGGWGKIKHFLDEFLFHLFFRIFLGLQHLCVITGS